MCKKSNRPDPLATVDDFVSRGFSGLPELDFVGMGIFLYWHVQIFLTLLFRRFYDDGKEIIL